MKNQKGPLIALAAAVLFGASTPAAKAMLGTIHPQLLAGLLYFGSGCGLGIWSAVQRRGANHQDSAPTKSDLLWLAGAITCGGILGPVSLMFGLQHMPGSAASLLLNAEGVFTALIAWFVFKENFDRRIFLGMVAIAAGSCVLSWQPGAFLSLSLAAMAVLAACLCWAIDNNLTRNVSNLDPVHIAAAKGIVAGLINCTIALSFGAQFPSVSTIGAAALVGLFGYGVSLVLFIRALRLVGTARTGAYFSTAPFAGACLSVVLLHEPISAQLIAATALMAIGVWLHLTETHEHEHFHPAEEHEHMHTHDVHHQHEHSPGDPPGEEHTHRHAHPPLRHSHPHFPDTMHRHEH